jgi:hypothetical protein
MCESVRFFSPFHDPGLHRFLSKSRPPVWDATMTGLDIQGRSKTSIRPSAKACGVLESAAYS